MNYIIEQITNFIINSRQNVEALVGNKKHKNKK